MFSPKIINKEKNSLILNYSRSVSKVIVCVLGDVASETITGHMIYHDMNVLEDVLEDELEWLDKFEFDEGKQLDWLFKTKSKPQPKMPVNTFVCDSILYGHREQPRADQHFLIFHPDSKKFSINVKWDGAQTMLMYRTYYSNGDKDQEIINL